LKAENNPAADEQPIEEIIVLGSRIKRKDYNTISPVFTIDESAFDSTGTTNVEDLLSDAVQFKPYFDRTSNNPGAGVALLDLRGLGAHRTLIMINGRRVGASSVFGGVNVNHIPAVLIDRVEVLTGGGAAVYGSDAVSGAVNFELDTEYEGIQFDSQYDVFEAGDGKVVDVNLSFGKVLLDGDANVSGYLGYQERQAVYQADREFSRVPLEDDSDTGTLREGGSITTPGGAIGFPPVFFPGFGLAQEGYLVPPDSPARPFQYPDDLYNYAPSNYLQLPLEREVAGLFGRLDLESGIRLNAELMYSHADSGQQLAPTPFNFAYVLQNVDHPLLTQSQSDFFSQNLDRGDGTAAYVVFRRLEEVGPRRSDLDAESWRVMVGADGILSSSWEWRSYYSFSHSESEVVINGAALRSRIEQGLLADPVTNECFDPSNGCVPLTLLGEGSLSAEAAEFIRANSVFNSSEFDEQMISLIVAGDLLPAWGLKSAFGLEWRESDGRFGASEEFKAGDVVGFGADSDVGGGTSVWEAYAELLYPLYESVSSNQSVMLEAGARYSRYSDAGAAKTWKVGADWQLGQGLRMRTMWQRAIRAPNLQELFQDASPEFWGGYGGDDKCSADADPIANGLLDVCVAQGIPADQVGVFVASNQFPATSYYGNGNTSLESEKADTLTLGVVMVPERISNLRLAIDYYEIEIEDSIGIVDDPLGICFELNDPGSRYCGMILRGAGFNIAEVTHSFYNQALEKTRGVDVQADVLFELNNRQVNLGVSGSKLLEQGRQADPLTSYTDTAGYFTRFFFDFSTPGERVNIGLDWISQRWTFGINWSWINGLRNPAGKTAIPDIGSLSYFDTSVAFDVTDQVTLRGGIGNVFDKQPPMLADHGQANTEPQIYDVFGRRFFLSLSFAL
jgi:outer membrane cobalamin receptor